MGSKKTKIKCQYCNKLFMTKPIKKCIYHFCNECVYLWMLNSLTDLYTFEKPKCVLPVC